MKPSSRKEVLINDVCSDGVCDVKPVSREEYWLVETLKRSGGGGGAKSWHDLEDRPFEDNTVVYYEGNDLYSKCEKVADTEESGAFYFKLSENVPSAHDVVGVSAISSDGYVYTYAEDDIVEADGYVDVIDNFYLVPNEANVYGTSLGKGFWTWGTLDDECFYTKVYKESIKKMDSKYVNLYTRLYEMGTNLFHDEAHEHGVTKAELDEIISNSLVMVKQNDFNDWWLAVGFSSLPEDEYACIYVLANGNLQTFYSNELEGK